MNDFQPLDDDEVLYVTLGRVLMANPTFKVGEFLDALAQAISDRENDWADENEGWFSDGLECEALRFNGQGWQRGKVRIRLEFLPEGLRGSLPPDRRSSSARRTDKADTRLEEYRPNREDIYRPERPRLNLDDAYPASPDEY